MSSKLEEAKLIAKQLVVIGGVIGGLIVDLIRGEEEKMEPRVPSRVERAPQAELIVKRAKQLLALRGVDIPEQRYRRSASRLAEAGDVRVSQCKYNGCIKIWIKGQSQGRVVSKMPDGMPESTSEIHHMDYVIEVLNEALPLEALADV